MAAAAMGNGRGVRDGRPCRSRVGMFFREVVVVCVAENTFSRNTYWQTKILPECSAGQ